MDWSSELRHLASYDVELAPGLSENELQAAEARVECRFPLDLRSFLQEALPTGNRWPNWRDPENAFIASRLTWAAEGIAFDIENNFWWPAWGPKPDSFGEAVLIMQKQIDAAPKLIPIFGHVFLPAEPDLNHNPVLSIWQTDMIYGGRNLSDYLLRIGNSDDWELPYCDEVRRIRFWSEIIEWNGGCRTRPSCVND